MSAQNVSFFYESDLLGSPIRQIRKEQATRLNYTAFGYCSGLSARKLGFTGQMEEAGDQYLLGNGYRPYLATLHRFAKPDDLSPFSSGGINPYAYCAADPLNFIDPDGHAFARSLGKFFQRLGGRKAGDTTRLLEKFKNTKASMTEYATALNTAKQNLGIYNFTQTGTKGRSRFGEVAKLTYKEQDELAKRLSRNRPATNTIEEQLDVTATTSVRLGYAPNAFKGSKDQITLFEEAIGKVKPRYDRYRAKAVRRGLIPDMPDEF